MVHKCRQKRRGRRRKELCIMGSPLVSIQEYVRSRKQRLQFCNPSSKSTGGALDSSPITHTQLPVEICMYIAGQSGRAYWICVTVSHTVYSSHAKTNTAHEVGAVGSMGRGHCLLFYPTQALSPLDSMGAVGKGRWMFALPWHVMGLCKWAWSAIG